MRSRRRPWEGRGRRGRPIMASTLSAGLEMVKDGALEAQQLAPFDVT